jgi:hypothetical protein
MPVLVALVFGLFCVAVVAALASVTGRSAASWCSRSWSGVEVMGAAVGVADPVAGDVTVSSRRE